MLQPFTQIQKFGQDNLDATMKALGAFSALRLNMLLFTTETTRHGLLSRQDGTRTFDGI